MRHAPGGACANGFATRRYARTVGRVADNPIMTLVGTAVEAQQLLRRQLAAPPNARAAEALDYAARKLRTVGDLADAMTRAPLDQQAAYVTRIDRELAECLAAVAQAAGRGREFQLILAAQETTKALRADVSERIAGQRTAERDEQNREPGPPLPEDPRQAAQQIADAAQAALQGLQGRGGQIPSTQRQGANVLYQNLNETRNRALRLAQGPELTPAAEARAWLTLRDGLVELDTYATRQGLQPLTPELPSLAGQARAAAENTRARLASIETTQEPTQATTPVRVPGLNAATRTVGVARSVL